jgi:hypothetical protein
MKSVERKARKADKARKAHKAQKPSLGESHPGKASVLIPPDAFCSALFRFRGPSFTLLSKGRPIPLVSPTQVCVGGCIQAQCHMTLSTTCHAQLHNGPGVLRAGGGMTPLTDTHTRSAARALAARGRARGGASCSVRATPTRRPWCRRRQRGAVAEGGSWSHCPHCCIVHTVHTVAQRAALRGAGGP